MVRIPFRQVWYILLFVAVGLAIAHVLSLHLKYTYGNPRQLGFARLVNLDGEHNLASWYSSVILLLSALLLTLIWRLSRHRADPLSRYWLGLALIFFYIAIDEAATIHETVVERLVIDTLPTFTTSGYLLYPWVLAGAAFVGAVGLTYWRFLARIPPRTRVGFIIAGTLYVSGALGVDMLEANQESTSGQATLGYGLLVGLEEGLEMA